MLKAQIKSEDKKDSFLQHVDETFQFYTDIFNLDHAQMSATNFDFTHLSHSAMSGHTMTGVPAVENSILLTLGTSEYTQDIGAIVWCSDTNKFYQTAEFKLEKLTQLAKSQEQQNFAYYFRKHTSTAPFMISERNPVTIKKRVFYRIKATIIKSPKPVQGVATKFIRLIRPTFSLELPPSYIKIPNKGEGIATVSRGEEFARTYISPVEANPARNSRLVLMGQPWISNERYLSSLEKLVQAHSLELWANVPDIVYVTDVMSFDQKTRETYSQRLMRVLKISSKVLTISFESEHEIRQYAKSRKIPVDIKKIDISATSPLMHSDWKASKPVAGVNGKYVLYVSSFNSRKRHDFLVEVWNEVRRNLTNAKDVKLILVGKPQKGFERYGNPDYKKTLSQNNIEILNNIDNAQLTWLYQNCLFTVYPSRKEGWGLPPVESLHFGKPCVLSNSIPSGKDIESPALIQVSDDDFYQWCSTISQLLERPDLLDHYCQHAAQYQIPNNRMLVNDLLDKYDTETN